MAFVDEFDTRAMEAEKLWRQYPAMRDYLDEGETPVAASPRRPSLATGLCCVGVGLFSAAQIIMMHSVLSLPLAFAGVLCCAPLVWGGVWLALFARRELVVITDRRICHIKTGWLGRSSQPAKSVPLSRISGVRRLRDSILFKKSHSGGDLIVKISGGGACLFPSLRRSDEVAEALTAELARLRVADKGQSENSEG